MSIIEVENLTRDFEYYEKEVGFKGSVKNFFKRGKCIRHAVSNVSFSVEPGEIVGFIGPNGAGKTTTLKMLSGILHPTSGTATVNGYIPWERKDGFKRSFALVAGQKSQLWADLPAIESLNLNKYIYEIPDEQYKTTVAELTEMLDVKEFLKVQVRRLSLGERMKMELIAALLHSPSVFLLDEPTIGLDILSQKAIRKYLKEYNRKTGATVILTSHYTKDIEELCDHTIIISGGEKVFDGQLCEISKYISDKKIINLTFSNIVNSTFFEQFGQVVDVNQNKISIEVEYQKISEVLPKVLSSFQIEDFTITDPSIEKSIELIYKEKSLKG